MEIALTEQIGLDKKDDDDDDYDYGAKGGMVVMDTVRPSIRAS